MSKLSQYSDKFWSVDDKPNVVNKINENIKWHVELPLCISHLSFPFHSLFPFQQWNEDGKWGLKCEYKWNCDLNGDRIKIKMQ